MLHRHLGLSHKLASTSVDASESHHKSGPKQQQKRPQRHVEPQCPVFVSAVETAAHGVCKFIINHFGWILICDCDVMYWDCQKWYIWSNFTVSNMSKNCCCSCFKFTPCIWCLCIFFSFQLMICKQQQLECRKVMKQVAEILRMPSRKSKRRSPRRMWWTVSRILSRIFPVQLYVILLICRLCQGFFSFSSVLLSALQYLPSFFFSYRFYLLRNWAICSLPKLIILCPKLIVYRLIQNIYSY